MPVILKNGNRKMNVNTLLDYASTQTYINADIAAHLGLQGKFQQVTVNVLKGQIKTFDTMSVEFELESLKVQMKCFSFIPEFERAAKIRKIAVYRFLISLLVPEL